jgi:hypothetical protein
LPGQRYDVIVTADQGAGDFWLRAVAQKACSANANLENILGIVRYDSSSTAEPTTSPYDSANLTVTNNCYDEDMSNLVPYLSIDAGSTPGVETDFSVTLASFLPFTWKMGPKSFVSQWDYPTALQVYEGNMTWGDEQNVQVYDTADVWVYWVVQVSLIQTWIFISNKMQNAKCEKKKEKKQAIPNHVPP